MTNLLKRAREMTFATALLFMATASAPMAMAQEEVATNIAGDNAMARSVKSFSDMTAGQPSNDKIDRVLFFSQNEAGEFLVAGMAVTEHAAPMDLPEGVAAVLKVRYGISSKIKQPDSGDAVFLGAHGVPLYVTNAKSKKMWEVGKVDDAIVYRKIKGGGKLGKWKALPVD